jgi:hypothetical protein
VQRNIESSCRQEVIHSQRRQDGIVSLSRAPVTSRKEKLCNRDIGGNENKTVASLGSTLLATPQKETFASSSKSTADNCNDLVSHITCKPRTVLRKTLVSRGYREAISFDKCSNEIRF